jgi:hypothetical protein
MSANGSGNPKFDQKRPVKPLIKRCVPVAEGLRFEYEVQPHRAFEGRAEQLSPSALDSVSTAQTGGHIPFKQVRLKGQINPLKPPLHVETVLIGRALGQQTGYLHGVGFRIRDDGYVEGEFIEGARKFVSFDKFRDEVSCRLPKASA